MMNSKTRNGSQADAALLASIAGVGAVEGPSAPIKLTLKGFAELAGDARGAVFVEYLTLICLIILGGSAAVVSLGQPLVHLYRVANIVLGLPIP